MKDWFSATELAELPDLPGTSRGITARAKREQWPYLPRAGRGGGKVYPLRCLPSEARFALVLKPWRVLAEETKKTLSPRDGDRLNLVVERFLGAMEREIKRMERRRRGDHE